METNSRANGHILFVCLLDQNKKNIKKDCTWVDATICIILQGWAVADAALIKLLGEANMQGLTLIET